MSNSSNAVSKTYGPGSNLQKDLGYNPSLNLGSSVQGNGFNSAGNTISGSGTLALGSHSNNASFLENTNRSMQPPISMNKDLNQDISIGSPYKPSIFSKPMLNHVVNRDSSVLTNNSTSNY